MLNERSGTSEASETTPEPARKPDGNGNQLAKDHYVRQEGTGLTSYWTLIRRGRRAALEGNATAPPPVMSQPMKTAATLLGIVLLVGMLAGCGASSDTAQSSASPSAAPSTVTVMATPTSTSPSVKPVDADLCAEVRNEMVASGLGLLLDQAIKGEKVPFIALAYPIKNYQAVSPGAASPALADQVIELNAAIRVMQAGDWGTWTTEEVKRMAFAYDITTTVCEGLTSQS